LPILTLGEYTYGTIDVNPITYPDGGFAEGSVVVGKYCSLGPDIKAMFFRDHRVDWISTFPFPSLWGARSIEPDCVNAEPIVIGNDVWIGSHTMLLSGAKIGDGAVIGAFSVVAGKIDPYTVVVGNPAKTIKKRFSDECIQMLLDIRWWDWPREKVMRYIDLLCCVDAEKFIQMVKNDVR
jgi:acetyltransferase-like isoleucine patch superfamily enzyme